MKKTKYFFIILGLFVFLGLHVSAQVTTRTNKFVENIISEFIDGDSGIFARVTIRLDYIVNQQFMDVKTDTELLNLRKENKKYHTPKNEKIVSTFPKLHSKIEVSSYSPFLFVNYSTYLEYNKDAKTYNL